MSQRASDADRERALALLQRAFADGRLSEDELRARIDRVLHATSQQALTELTHDVAAPSSPPSTSSKSSSPHKGRHGEHGDTDGLRPTDERFRDPSTKRVMRVWLTASGERRYLPD